MPFHADLHVHSKYSRATSRDLDLEHLAHWAARKGIGVIATGDFTHPAWNAELREKLVPAEPGLFRLRDDIEKSLAATLPAACRIPVRFMLEVEISTIYKKGEKTRKVHHLIYAPDFSAVERISTRLARIGNIASDGRPILGLDSRNLLEITLDADPDAYLIPAHIWTPWFAALGSQSGFDSITECYGDLADNIFAVETGLSSDPAMNWRVSFLDRYRLVSNSDAHSPGKLGREATIFDCDVDYFAIRDALKTGRGYVGTVEFFPEEGKYHLDGHRKCGVRLTPRETLAQGGRCPVCGQPLTIGVEHRVETLADREPENLAPPPTAGAVTCLVPLPEILSEIHATGPTSKPVERDYNKLVAKFGPELFILQSAPVEDVARATSSLFGEALMRLRAGRVIRHAGYDGEYGVIQLFDDGELKRISCGTLFDAPAPPTKNKQSTPLVLEETAAPDLPSSLPTPSPGHGKREPTASDRIEVSSRASAPAEIIEKAARERAQAESATKLCCRDPLLSGRSRADDSSPRSTAMSPTSDFQENAREKFRAPTLAALDADQRRAAALVEGPLLIIARPGSGKTRTLTHRIAHIISDHATAPAQCLAITFTRRAAEEMRVRLTELLGERATHIPIHTFHSLGLSILRQWPAAAGLNAEFHIADPNEQMALLARSLDLSERKTNTMLRAISRAKRCGTAESAMVEAIAAYQRTLNAANAVDFDDLIGLTVGMLGADANLCKYYHERFRFISVDEFQDLDEQQYRLLKLLAPADANLCVIGDPDQAIYGFRGAAASHFDRFEHDYPNAVTVRLVRNYRSNATIVTASNQMMAAGRTAAGLIEIVRNMHRRISIHAAASERAEAEFVVASIERLIGGHNFFSLDSGRADGGAGNDLSFADIAVLYRTGEQSAALITAFERSGIPFKKPGHASLSLDEGIRALLREMDSAGDIENLQPIIERLKASATPLERKTIDQERTSLTLGPDLQTTLAARFGGNQQLSDALALATDADLFDPRADRVSLLTLHAAKGLEFPVVFIVGLEDGLLPLYWNELDAATAAEERRLFYVGMTRAKDQLVLTRALKRTWRGRVRQQCVSPFLADIESALLDHQHNETSRRPQDRQLSLF